MIVARILLIYNFGASRRKRGIVWLMLPVVFVAASVLLSACSASVGDDGIKGMAVLDGTGAGGADVSVYSVPEPGGSPPVATAVTDGDGNFSVELAPGTYYITVSYHAPDGDNYVSEEPSDPVAVTSGISWAGEFELGPESVRRGALPGTGVSGMVLSAGLPVADAVVSVFVTGADGMKGRYRAGHAASGEDGWFTVNVKPGMYFVLAEKTLLPQTPEGAAPAIQPVKFSGECQANPVSVRAGEYTGIGEIAISVPGFADATTASAEQPEAVTAVNEQKAAPESPVEPK